MTILHNYSASYDHIFRQQMLITYDCTGNHLTPGVTELAE